MSRYADRPDAIAALVRDTEIHRDCYVDDEVFGLQDVIAVVFHDDIVPDDFSNLLSI